MAEENQTNGVVNDGETRKGSLCLNLKNPAKVADDHHHQFMEEEDLQLQQQQQQQQRRLLRTCSKCGHQFTSGKALGGHKRACLQKIKNNNSTQKPKIKINAVAVKSSDRGEVSNNHICYVCHQSFRSVKSLYGHMRKHPEREWRGVQPPKRLLMNPHHHHHHQSASAFASSQTRISHDHDDDGGDDTSMGSGGVLVESLKGWSAKRKRGQRLIMSSSSEEEEEDEEEAMQQAVDDLLLLAQLSANDCAAMSSKNNVSSAGCGYGVLKIKEKRRKIDDNEEEDQDDDGAKKKVNIEMKDNGLGFDDCNSEDTWIYHDDDEDDDSDEMKMMNQEKKNKKRRLNELEDAVDVATVKREPMVAMAITTQTYTCPICNKTFDKHQALGGHLASDHKNKNVKESSSASATSSEDTKAEEKDRQAAAASDKETGESLRVQATAAAGSSEHKCNICNKSCHWTGPAEAFSNSSRVATSAGEVTQRALSSHRVAHDFDLNDTPPEYYQFHGVKVAAAATVS